MAPELFLLEHRPVRPSAADLARLHRALVYAVVRLARSGVPVRLVGAVYVPDEPQCLYVLEAAEAAQVARVADTAGVSIMRVRRIIRLVDAPDFGRQP